MANKKLVFSKIILTDVVRSIHAGGTFAHNWNPVQSLKVSGSVLWYQAKKKASPNFDIFDEPDKIQRMTLSTDPEIEVDACG